jgi:glycosyltransferase involved in cell wall biosynthesis
MWVIHVDTGREMRGGQWQAFHLIAGLPGAGWRCTLLAPEASPLYRRAKLDGYDARPLKLSGLWRLSRKVEVIHAHDARGHTLAALVSAPRLVVSRRVAFPVQQTVLSRWKYSKAARYLAVSEFVKRTLLEAGVGSERVSVVYDGVPLAEQARLSSRIVAPKTEDPRKGSALLREAAAIAGVEVHFSSNLADDLKEAGGFAYITESEGLGSGVLLAMAAGVPVVASRVGGLPEVVEDGVSGLLTNNDPVDIASHIRGLLDDRAAAAEMAARARQRVAQRFSVETMVRKTLENYEGTLRC